MNAPDELQDKLVGFALSVNGINSATFTPERYAAAARLAAASNRLLWRWARQEARRVEGRAVRGRAMKQVQGASALVGYAVDKLPIMQATRDGNTLRFACPKCGKPVRHSFTGAAGVPDYGLRASDCPSGCWPRGYRLVPHRQCPVVAAAAKGGSLMRAQ